MGLVAGFFAGLLVGLLFCVPLVRVVDAASAWYARNRFHVGLSFANAQRDNVQRVAWTLKTYPDLEFFFDEHHRTEGWGEHLRQWLTVVFGQECRAVVVFWSAEYAEGDFTRCELEAIANAADAGVHVLPVVCDGTPLPDWLAELHQLPLVRYNGAALADEIVAKLADVRVLRRRPVSERRPMARRPARSGSTTGTARPPGG
jgi:hypothetical protein